ncbi:MAG: hypothetical protein AB7O50_04050 [Pseudolabrys sp.]
MDEFNIITKAINQLGAIAEWRTIGAIVAAGTIAMAFLQMLKDLTPIRRIYQRFWLKRWLREHADSDGDARSTSSARSTLRTRSSPEKTHDRLIELTTGGAERAFYDLPSEQIVAQMNAAAQLVLDYPKKYSDVLVVMADGADADDIAAILDSSPRGTRSAKSKSERSQEFLEARVRVNHQIQRNLDAIQIALSNSWRFWMQIMSILLSTLIIVLSVMNTGDVRFSTILIAALVGLAGGYLAPVSRDLVVALQNLRK